ncbi:MAG: 3'(2'),5'-bisphosphate nucleotidase CysQ [Gemmobacter sp.]
MPGDDLALIETAVREAGAVALRHWRRNPRVWEKPGGAGPVSEADLAVDALLSARLRGARPGYGWLSEESAQAAAVCDAGFIVDPIDGTRAFLDGQDGFAVSVAVMRDGRITEAAVFLPARETLYSATADGIARMNGAPLAASRARGEAGAEVLATRPSMDPEHWPGGVPRVRRSFRPSLAWRLCLVGEGRFDGMLTMRDAWEWDIAAASLIAERAGARVTDRDGRPLRFGAEGLRAPGVIAAAPGLHEALIARRRGTTG